MLELLQFFSRIRVPETDIVESGGDLRLAIRREDNTCHEVGVSPERAEPFACGDFPEADGPIPRRRGQFLAVGSEGKPHHSLAVSPAHRAQSSHCTRRKRIAMQVNHGASAIDFWRFGTRLHAIVRSVAEGNDAAEK